MSKTKVQIIESEAGWGQKIDEEMEFDTYELAEKWVRDYNRKHNPPKKQTPEWYMFARIVGDFPFGMKR